jgi:prophage regulatory protein
MYSESIGVRTPREPLSELVRLPAASSPPQIRLLRLRQVLQIIPISKSAWFAGIRAGRFPAGRQFGPRVTVWRSDEIEALVRAVL